MDAKIALEQALNNVRGMSGVARRNCEETKHDAGPEHQFHTIEALVLARVERMLGNMVEVEDRERALEPLSQQIAKLEKVGR